MRTFSFLLWKPLKLEQEHISFDFLTRYCRYNVHSFNEKNYDRATLLAWIALNKVILIVNFFLVGTKVDSSFAETPLHLYDHQLMTSVVIIAKIRNDADSYNIFISYVLEIFFWENYSTVVILKGRVGIRACLFQLWRKKKKVFKHEECLGGNFLRFICKFARSMRRYNYIARFHVGRTNVWIKVSMCFSRLLF